MAGLRNSDHRLLAEPPFARHEVAFCEAPMRALLLVTFALLASGARVRGEPAIPPAPVAAPIAAPAAIPAIVPAAEPPAAKKQAVAVPVATATLCGALEAAARKSELPLGFFTRLIWQESRFDPGARSPAGAQGVAQFMPATAGERGLLDPFEPTRALEESAGYLKDLHAQFGNWGLAAAAYNAGPGRVARWLAGGPFAMLPQETVGYVVIVTGHDVDTWRGAHPPELPPEPKFSCLAFAGEAGRRAAPPTSPADPNAPLPKAWSVIIVGALSRQAVLREYGIVRASHNAVLGTLTPTIVRRRIGGQLIPRFVAQIERDDRASSNLLCKRLEASGGVCVVLRNAGR